MKKYYLHNGKENTGPFDKEQLKEQKINKNTLVWSEDMTDWKKAGEIDELKAILLTIPPPLYKPQKDEYKKTPKRNTIKYIIVIVFLMAFVAIGSTIISEYGNNNDVNIIDTSNNENQRQTRNNITNLIQVTTNQYSVDSFGGISNLDVMVTNNTNYTIDQITVAIDYIKQNDGIYKTEYLTFNNIPANQNKSLSAPDSNRGLSVNLTTQTVNSSELNLCYDNNTIPVTGDPDPYKCN